MGFKFLNLISIYNPKTKQYFSRITSSTTHYNFSTFSHHNTDNHKQSTSKSLGPNDSLSSNIIISRNHQQIFKRWHFGHHHHHHHNHDQVEGYGKKSENIFRLGLGADIGLAVGKALTGYLSGSTAIIADAAHSLSDVVLSGVALLSFKAARVPRDKEHPYGHGKFETLGALGISSMLLVTAGGIAWHAADILLGWFAAAPEIVNHSSIQGYDHHGHDHKIDMDHPLLALNVTILSIAVKESLYWITKKAGEKEGSGLMKANAWHHRADAVSSFVALIGVGGSILGVKFLDPLAGLVVSGMIFKAGLESGYQSIMELVDAAVPKEELDPHRQTILQVEGVKGCHRLRGRRAGSFLHLDVHIEVDPFTSVSAAHHIGENVRHRLHESHPEVAEVFIHIDPSISPESIVEKSSYGCDKVNDSFILKSKDIDDVISCIFMSQFPKQLKLEHITPHLLQNKIMLDIEVSMPPDIMIRDAMLMAEDVKKEILGNVSDVIQVSIQLRLSPSNHTTLL